MTVYTDPSGAYSGDGSEFLGAMGAYLGCVAVFTLLLLVLYLWLFYRIFQKAGYSGWMTLLNLIPYLGSIVVIFILAFGDWPALRGRGSGPAPGTGYPPAYPPTYSPTGQPPIPPAGPGYQPPAPPMGDQPDDQPPVPPSPLV